MKLLYVFTISMIPFCLESAYAMDGDMQPISTNHPHAVRNGTQKQVYNDVEDWLKENDTAYNTQELKRFLIKLSKANDTMEGAR